MTNKTDAIILAGGFGTRLQKVVSSVPKPLAPIRGIPFLDLLINQLASFSSVGRIILAVGYKAGKILEHFKETSFPLYFSIEETPLGTGGALKRALNLVKTPHVLATNGDCFTDYSLKGFYQSFLEKKADISLLGKQMEDTSRYGTVSIDPTTSQILSFEEKIPFSEKGWISCGTYLFRKSLFSDLPFESPSFSLEKEVFPLCLQKRFFMYPCDKTFVDIGTEKSFQQAQTALSNLCNIS